jgi:single-strand DNA-binding protein|tara:strand:+ start:256 stop:696 length:441 start_codon:yes stop_codon:yes gene_type:complete
MSGINKVILIGNLGAKPELKYGASGNAIANISVATSDSWTDKDTGQKQERTEWHRVSMFGKLAEIANQYTDKGSKVYVEGKLETRKYTDNAGVEKYSTSIVISGFNGVFQILDSAKNITTNTDTVAQETTTELTPADPIFDDVIPF